MKTQNLNSSPVEDMDIDEKSSEVLKLRGEIERLKDELARLEGEKEKSLNGPVVEVTFRNKDLAQKYKTSVDNFLHELLSKEENFTLNSRVLKDNGEVQSVQNLQVFQNFCIDSINQNGSSSAWNTPFYCSTYDEALHDNENDKANEEKSEPEERIQTVTCFNCLGNHHLKDCPEKHDRMRITRNRKGYQQALQNTSRYHEDEEQKSKRIPGTISNDLYEALNLRPDQLPLYIYKMRVLGYPPGWLKEAEIETSGLTLYDSEGNAVSDGNKAPYEGNERQYDSQRLIQFPGFNSPVPAGVKDEWQALRMPSLQAHQQLSVCLKNSNVHDHCPYKKRRMKGFSDSNKKLKGIQEDVPLESSSGEGTMFHKEDKRNSSFSNVASPKLKINESNSEINSKISPAGKQAKQTPQSNFSDSCNSTVKLTSSASLSVSLGTAILDRGNPFKKLPDSDKFADGITEHLPFENLPNSVGTFEKMRTVLDGVRQKLNFQDGNY